MPERKRRLHRTDAGKTVRRFVTYGGYIPELDMFLNDGRYFKVYGLGMPAGGRVPVGLLGHPGFRLQVVATREQVYGLYGTVAGNPEEAAEKFRELEQTGLHHALTCGEWFGLMAGLLGHGTFPGLPEEEEGRKKWGRKPAAIRLVQPFRVKIRQKELEISGHVVKTMVLLGCHTGMFPAFATELLRTVRNVTLAVFAEELDREKCLEGLTLSSNIPPVRKAVMGEFLERAVAEGTRLYSTCALVSVRGLPVEVEDGVRVLEAFCGKYRVRVSGLDYQQADACRSVLPLMKNRIRYSRVLTEETLGVLLPWSLLEQCRKNVCYGDDVVSGRVKYDRRIHRENGMILAGDPDWAVDQARKEMLFFAATPGTPGGTVSILAGKDTDISVFGGNGGTESRLDRGDTELHPNGENMEFHPDSGDTEFRLESGGTAAYRYRSVPTGYGTVYQVLEDGERGRLAYAMLLKTLHGTVYSLNSEYLAGSRGGLCPLHGDTLYTFLSRDNRVFYGSREFAGFLETFPFLLAGEHKIFEKLELASAAGFDRQEREWISEPAQGAVLRTKLASYRLKKEDMEPDTVPGSTVPGGKQAAAPGDQAGKETADGQKA